MACANCPVERRGRWHQRDRCSLDGTCTYPFGDTPQPAARIYDTGSATSSCTGANSRWRSGSGWNSVGVVSVFNLESSGVEAPERRSYVDAPLARTFLTCPQIGRLQPYVRPLCATGLAAGPDDNRGSDPRSRHRALRRWSPRAFPIPGLAGLHHVSIALPN